MPVRLSQNNRFAKVREQSGAIANDSLPLATTVADDQRVDSGAATNIICYWTATTPTGTVTLRLYVLDGNENKFVLQDEQTLVPFDSIVVLKAYGASNCVVSFQDTGAASGTDAKVFAYSWNES